MSVSGNVYQGYFLLTPQQRRFKAMLSKYPNLSSFWDFQTGECDVESLRLKLDNFSHDEREMARFFVTMWVYGNPLNFDVITAARTLDDEHWKVIEYWLSTLEQPRVSFRMMRHA